MLISMLLVKGPDRTFRYTRHVSSVRKLNGHDTEIASSQKDMALNAILLDISQPLNCAGHNVVLFGILWESIYRARR